MFSCSSSSWRGMNRMTPAVARYHRARPVTMVPVTVCDNRFWARFNMGVARFLRDWTRLGWGPALDPGVGFGATMIGWGLIALLLLLLGIGEEGAEEPAATPVWDEELLILTMAPC